MAFAYPHVLTIHESDMIQIYNVENNLCDRFMQDKDVIAGSKSILADGKTILAIAAKKFTIWDRDNMLQVPRSVVLEGASCLSVINEQKSELMPDNRVIVVNASPGGHVFQMWDYTKGELLCYGENPSKSEIEVNFFRCDDTIITTTRDTLHIWKIAGKGSIRPVNVKFTDSIVTAVHLDKHFLIVGDHYGGVTLHNTEGKLIYHLNRVKRGDTNIKDAQLATPFKAQVHQLARIGRWVVVAFENSKAEVFDLFNSNTTAPCDAYVHPVNASIHEFVIREHKVFLAVDTKAVRNVNVKHKPDIIVWAPKLEFEGFESFAEEVPPPSSAVDILSYGCTGLSTMVKKLEGVLRPEDVKPLLACLANADANLKEVGDLPIPFLIFQNVQESLDNYESRLNKMYKQGTAVRVGKVKDHLEVLNTALAQSVHLMSQTVIFLRDVRKKLGTTATTATSDEVVVASSGNKRLLRKKSVDEQDDAVDELLFDVISNLGNMYENLVDQTERYDQVCNAGIPDPDKVMKLLNIYTKLKQMAEDLKETGKVVGDFRSEDGNGQWWEGGGCYEDEDPATDPAQ
eukprot:TRINITY_DN4640_c0_g1_i1.p1 TRINITY_DN4640_c0_g1~~TRINITY_DN4640_c0_g1_i1.p1  ORF type:complete len:663 (-),score=178.99 TRINITY_DN4640_c0_g1_i1:40-1752(-)